MNISITPAGKIIFDFRYDVDTKDFVKGKGAKFDPGARNWYFPSISDATIAATRAIATYEDITLSPEVEARFAALQDAKGVSVRDGKLIVSGINADKVVEVFKTNPESNSQLEKIYANIRRSKSAEGLPEIEISGNSFQLKRLISLIEKHLPQTFKDFLDGIKSHLPALIEAAEAQEAANIAYSSAPAADAQTIAKITERLPAAFAGSLMPHQWPAIDTIATHEQTLLADDQGLGKTLEILAGIEASGSYPCIVVCPKSAVLNWRDEVERWLPARKISVLASGTGKKDAGVPPAEADFLILNYEAFKKASAVLKSASPKALVADEAHYLKTYNSARTKAVAEFCRENKIARRIAATGTPILNKIGELLTLLTLLPAVLDATGGFWHFASRYCNATRCKICGNEFWDLSGSSNLDELPAVLRGTGAFVRRTKTELKLITPKAYITKEVQLSNPDEYELASEDLRAWLIERSITKAAAIKKKNEENKNPSDKESDEEEEDNEGKIAAFGRALGLENIDISSADQAEALRRITALRQIVGRGKIDATIDYINKISADGRKIVIFAHHIEVQEAILSSFKSAKIKALAITGQDTTAGRRKAIKDFQDPTGPRFIVCSIKAAQTAITLTAAYDAVMVELDWTPAGMAQAEDRIHRIGQAEQVSIHYINAKNTIDDHLNRILAAKREIIDDALAAPEIQPTPEVEIIKENPTPNIPEMPEIQAEKAPYGLKRDGTPRQAPAGPGRPRIAAEKRLENAKRAKSVWRQCKKAEIAAYMREYRKRTKTAA